MKNEPAEITGITLIDKVLEFTSMAPDPSSWTFEEQQPNASRFLRLLQIECLLNLFFPGFYKPQELQYGIESILYGGFIRGRKSEDYKNLFHKMDKVILKSKYDFKKEREWTVHELVFNYNTLLDYKRVLKRLLTFNHGTAEISYHYLYAYIKANSITDKINFKGIDEFLSNVIDPAKRTFSTATLMKEYNYPSDYDVYHIDDDNW